MHYSFRQKAEVVNYFTKREYNSGKSTSCRNMLHF